MLKRQIQYAIRKEKWYAARAKKQNRPIGEKAHKEAMGQWQFVLDNFGLQKSDPKKLKKYVDRANAATKAASKADCKFDPIARNPQWKKVKGSETLHAVSWPNKLNRNLCRIILDHKNKEVDVHLDNTGEIGVVQWQFGGKFRTALKQSRNELYDHITKKGYYDILDIQTTNGWYQFTLPIRKNEDAEKEGIVRLESKDPGTVALMKENERLRKAIAKIMHDLGHLIPHQH